MEFFQGFTLDTLLGCISCILGVIALFVGTKAYKKCNVYEDSLNDKKEFHDNSTDYSQRAAGDIINNNCDIEALTKINTANFDSCLSKAYATFEQCNKENLQNIIEQTRRIIEEHKPNLAGLTKIDWINVYFENAKNTSDEFMQKVWARVLARELEFPGSFSYKSLDALRNMSAEDFEKFEKLCSLVIRGWVFQDDFVSKYGLTYLDMVKLSEIGLLNLSLSQDSMMIEPHRNTCVVNNMIMISIENISDENVRLVNSVYLLSSVANELQKVANVQTNIEYAKECAEFWAKHNKNLKITLWAIDHINGNEVVYHNNKELYRCESE